jgi:hypothetical protein
MAAMWLWVSCGWCGFTGCAAPIGDACPKCLHPLEPPAAPRDPDHGNDETPRETPPASAA